LEYMGNKTETEVHEQIALIPERLIDIFASADKQQTPTNVVADAMAESIVANSAAKQQN